MRILRWAWSWLLAASLAEGAAGPPGSSITSGPPQTSPNTFIVFGQQFGTLGAGAAAVFVVMGSGSTPESISFTSPSVQNVSSVYMLNQADSSVLAQWVSGPSPNPAPSSSSSITVGPDAGPPRRRQALVDARDLDASLAVMASRDSSTIPGLTGESPSTTSSLLLLPLLAT